MNDTQGQEWHIYSNTHLKTLQFTLEGGRLLEKFSDLGVSLLWNTHIVIFREMGCQAN